MNKKQIDQFKEELKELMEKYEVEIRSYDQYDGLGEYCGTDYQFEIKMGDSIYDKETLDIREL